MNKVPIPGQTEEEPGQYETVELHSAGTPAISNIRYLAQKINEHGEVQEIVQQVRQHSFFSHSEDDRTYIRMRAKRTRVRIGGNYFPNNLAHLGGWEGLAQNSYWSRYDRKINDAPDMEGRFQAAARNAARIADFGGNDKEIQDGVSLGTHQMFIADVDMSVTGKNRIIAFIGGQQLPQTETGFIFTAGLALMTTLEIAAEFPQIDTYGIIVPVKLKLPDGKLSPGFRLELVQGDDLDPDIRRQADDIHDAYVLATRKAID